VPVLCPHKNTFAYGPADSVTLGKNGFAQGPACCLIFEGNAFAYGPAVVHPKARCFSGKGPAGPNNSEKTCLS